MQDQIRIADRNPGVPGALHVVPVELVPVGDRACASRDTAPVHGRVGALGDDEYEARPLFGCQLPAARDLGGAGDAVEYDSTDASRCAPAASATVDLPVPCSPVTRTSNRHGPKAGVTSPMSPEVESLSSKVQFRDASGITIGRRALGDWSSVCNSWRLV